MALERVEEAVDAYGRATTLAPDDLEAANNLGAALTHMGRFKDAVAVFRGASSLAPDDPRIQRNLANALRLEGDLEAAIDILSKAVADHGGDVSLHNSLGAALGVAGRHGEAAEAFREAIRHDPNQLESHYNLAGALQALADRDGAIKAYGQALRIDPDHASSRHMLAALSGENPARPPEGFVAGLFDLYAPNFEDHLVTGLAYRMPDLLKDQVAQYLDRRDGAGVILASALDLGCGTGIAGTKFRPLVRRLHGVDASRNMISEARRKGIYDGLWVDDAVSYMTTATETYDLIIAADVLTYLGDLTDLVRAAARRLRPGGLLSVTVEPDAEDGAFRLRSNGRYTHGEGPLRRCLKTAGLSVRETWREEGRRESGRPVEILFLLAERAGG